MTIVIDYNTRLFSNLFVFFKSKKRYVVRIRPIENCLSTEYLSLYSRFSRDFPEEPRMERNLNPTLHRKYGTTRNKNRRFKEKLKVWTKSNQNDINDKNDKASNLSFMLLAFFFFFFN